MQFFLLGLLIGLASASDAATGGSTPAAKKTTPVKDSYSQMMAWREKNHMLHMNQPFACLSACNGH